MKTLDMQHTPEKTNPRDAAQPGSSVHRYSARNMVKPVNFICLAPNASRVCLIGDFNNWDPGSHPMKRQPGGAWLIQVSLCRGHHHYQFLVDGKPILDPAADGIARDLLGARVSLRAVS
jgi:1,4-alpha-glucan branching enzyme